MTVNTWPAAIKYAPLESSWSKKPFLKPITSEFDGGNVRERGRPGDEVQVIAQVVPVDADDYTATLEPFLIANKGRRVVMPVWLGSAYSDCVVLLTDIDVVKSTPGKVDISMQLRVLREVSELTLLGTPVTTATEDVAYAGFTVVASGGVPGYTFSVQTGTLPAGITLNAETGQISGTPTTAGVSSGIVIRVTDEAGNTDDLAPFTLTVS